MSNTMQYIISYFHLSDEERLFSLISKEYYSVEMNSNTHGMNKVLNLGFLKINKTFDYIHQAVGGNKNTFSLSIINCETDLSKVLVNSSILSLFKFLCSNYIHSNLSLFYVYETSQQGLDGQILTEEMALYSQSKLSITQKYADSLSNEFKLLTQNLALITKSEQVKKETTWID
jgi:hypothetical protein